MVIDSDSLRKESDLPSDPIFISLQHLLSMITLLIELPVEHCEHLTLEHESMPCLMTLDEIVISLETVIIMLLLSYDSIC